MSTTSTDRLYASLVAGALAYVGNHGVPLGMRIGQRLYRQAAAPDADMPYAMFALRSPQLPAGNQSLKIVYQFEGFLFNRPRNSQPATEALADQWGDYLRSLRDATSGLLYCTDVAAESLPAASSPADATIVQIRLIAKVNVWPLFLSSLSQ